MESQSSGREVNGKGVSSEARRHYGHLESVICLLSVENSANQCEISTPEVLQWTVEGSRGSILVIVD